MLLNIKSAIEIRNYYQPILKESALSTNSKLTIDSIFFCHKDNVANALGIILNNNFNETLPLVGIKDQEERNLEVYAYTYDGADFHYRELDEILTEKGIEKIYDEQGIPNP